MAKRGGLRPTDDELEDVGPGLTEEGDVQVVHGPAFGAYFRPTAGAPRAWDRLTDEGQFNVAQLQKAAAQLHKLQGELYDHVRAARAAGVSWALVGWSIGTTGEAARQRFGEDE